MSSKNTRRDAIHVDVIGDKDGSNRAHSLGTASILGILPEGHVWTLAHGNQETQCCGTFHVDVEGQTTYIRCATTGQTILSGRGLVKTLQTMADITDTAVIVGHDPGASSTIKNAEYTPSGEFAPVAPVAEVVDAADIAEANAQAWCEAGSPRDDQGAPVVPVLPETGMTVITQAGVIAMVEAVNTLYNTVDLYGITEIGHLGTFDFGVLTLVTEAEVEAVRNRVKREGRVFVAEAERDGSVNAFRVLVAHGWATLVENGAYSRWVRTRYTADRVKITDGLAVWDYDLNVGRVVLSTMDGDGWFDVKRAGGGRSLMNGERVTTRHPHTRQTAVEALAEAEAEDAADPVTEAEVWAGTGTMITRAPIKLNGCKVKRTRVNARRVRGGF